MGKPTKKTTSPSIHGHMNTSDIYIFTRGLHSFPFFAISLSALCHKRPILRHPSKQIFVYLSPAFHLLSIITAFSSCVAYSLTPCVQTIATLILYSPTFFLIAAQFSPQLFIPNSVYFRASFHISSLSIFHTPGLYTVGCSSYYYSFMLLII